MKIKVSILLLGLLVFTLTGCSTVREFVDQIEISNQFSKFAPEFAEVLENQGSFSSSAEGTLFSTVSLEMAIEGLPEAGGVLTQNEINYFSFKIENVSREKFIVFLTANEKEEVAEELQEKWEKYDYLRSQNLSNIEIYSEENGTKFDDDTSFDSGTIGQIREIINVKNNTAELTAYITMEINDDPYSGSISGGFIKNEEWKINSLELNLSQD